MRETKRITAADLAFFRKMLEFDSTSGQERPMAEWLLQELRQECPCVETSPADAAPGDPINLYFKWGEPKIVFCSHLDTVPPYIAPTFSEMPDGDVVIRGRGSCDAKGQVFAMLMACRALAKMGHSDFGLLLLYGEETGSYGAKAFRQLPGAEYVVVGEPTDNAMVTASKGTKSFIVEIAGKPFHSGYPQYGDSAIETFVDLVEAVRRFDLPEDSLLGPTTYNIGLLRSDNPQNILSSQCSCKIYFRTTFATDQIVQDSMMALASDKVKITACGGDAPSRYLALEGFPQKTVAFGSDAPQLWNFAHKALCGPGSILVAHTGEEFIKLSDLEQGVENYMRIFCVLNNITTSV